VKKNVKQNKLVVETDRFLANGGMKRAKMPCGALVRARNVRDARVEPKKPSAKKATSKVEVVKAADWEKRFPWMVHGFSTRSGGVSTVFGGKDLNLGFSTSDKKTNVGKNRKLFMKELVRGRGSSTARYAVASRSARNDTSHFMSDSGTTLICMKQVHSSVIHVIREPRSAGAEPLVGDGMITNQHGMMLAVQTADCVPVLLVDTKMKVVGAFHAGWRGTVDRIVEKGVGMMRMEYGSKPKDIYAAIGPAIGGCCYAVGDEVVNAFRSQFAYADKLFHEVFDDDPVKKKYPLLFMTARAPGHGETGPQTHLDLFEANRQQLLAAGIPAKNIWVSGLCTSCDTTRFFSHRKESGFTGLQMAAIAIK